MIADPRIQKIMGLIDQVLGMLEGIQKDMQRNVEEEQTKAAPDDHKIAFYRSQAVRAQSLSDLLEGEVITMLIGLSNLSGPIKYLKGEE